jgi:hypothetical protein
MNWAHVTARKVFFLMLWHDTSHRFIVCRLAVRRSRLHRTRCQILDRYATRNNAYDSLCSAEYVASLPGHPKLCWRCLRLISHRLAQSTRIGVCQLLKIGTQNPDIIRNNNKNN